MDPRETQVAGSVPGFITLLQTCLYRKALILRSAKHCALFIGLMRFLQFCGGFYRLLLFNQPVVFFSYFILIFIQFMAISRLLQRWKALLQ